MREQGFLCAADFHGQMYCEYASVLKYTLPFEVKSQEMKRGEFILHTPCRYYLLWNFKALLYLTCICHSSNTVFCINA